MYILGHIGLTVAAARAVDKETDLRWAGLLAICPDLLDKPGSRLWPALVHHNTRGFGHTFLFSLAVLAALLAWKRRPKAALVLWGCYAGHFVLDSMWRSDNPCILFWPLLGDFPPPVRGPLFSGLVLANVLGEAAGLIALASLVRRYRLFERARLSSFLRTGRLAAALILCAAAAHAGPERLLPEPPAPAVARGTPVNFEAPVSTGPAEGAMKKKERGLRVFGVSLSGEDEPQDNEPYNAKASGDPLDWDIKARVKFDGLGARAKYRNPAALRSFQVGFLKYFDLPAAVGFDGLRDGVYEAVGATPDKPNGGFELGASGALNAHWGGATVYDSRSSVEGAKTVNRRTIGSTAGYSPLGDNPGKPWNYTVLLGVSHEARAVYAPGWMSDRSGLGFSAGVAYQRALDDVSPRWLKRVKGRAWVDGSAVRSAAANAAVELTVAVTDSLGVTGGVSGRYMPSPETGNPEEKTWDVGGIFGVDLAY